MVAIERQFYSAFFLLLSRKIRPMKMIILRVFFFNCLLYQFDFELNFINVLNEGHCLTEDNSRT